MTSDHSGLFCKLGLKELGGSRERLSGCGPAGQGPRWQWTGEGEPLGALQTFGCVRGGAAGGHLPAGMVVETEVGTCLGTVMSSLWGILRVKGSEASRQRCQVGRWLCVPGARFSTLQLTGLWRARPGSPAASPEGSGTSFLHPQWQSASLQRQWTEERTTEDAG